MELPRKANGDSHHPLLYPYVCWAIQIWGFAAYAVLCFKIEEIFENIFLAEESVLNKFRKWFVILFKTRSLYWLHCDLQRTFKWVGARQIWGSRFRGGISIVDLYHENGKSSGEQIFWNHAFKTTNSRAPLRPPYHYCIQKGNVFLEHHLSCLVILTHY